MYIEDPRDKTAFRYAEELQADAEPEPSARFEWQPLLFAAVLLGLVGLVV
jgi:hypothetical protein